MQVNNVLVEDICIDTERRVAVLNSTLYEFRDRKWVSVHWERSGKKLGPITVLDDLQEDLRSLENFSVTQFGERILPTEGKRTLTISYRDTWTIPPWTVYVVVFPRGFVSSEIRGRNQGYDYDTPLEIASTQDNRIFYYGIFYGAEEPFVFHIDLRLEENPRESKRLLESSKVVEGRVRFDGLRKRVAREALSTNFWFRLLEMAGKLIR